MEIVKGNSYKSKSGAVKKVLKISDDGKTLDYRITTAGTGKGNHQPKGTEGTQSVASFQSWAVSEA